MLAPIAHPRLEGWISWYCRQRRGIQANAAPKSLLEPTRISRMRPSVQLGQNVSIFVQVPWRLGVLDRLHARLLQKRFEPQVDGKVPLRVHIKVSSHARSFRDEWHQS